MIAYIDGASHGNPGPSGAGIVIYCDENKKPVKAFGYYLGELTNNMAEYMAVSLALITLMELSARAITIYSDSELLIRQVNGDYRVKNEKLLPLYLEVKFFLSKFKKIRLCHIRREKNRLADRLANRAIDAKGYVSN